MVCFRAAVNFHSNCCNNRPKLASQVTRNRCAGAGTGNSSCSWRHPGLGSETGHTLSPALGLIG